MKINAYLIIFLLCPVLSFSQWALQDPLPQDSRLRDVFFSDAMTGYCVGDNGTIIKTTNAGSSWIVLQSGTTQTLNTVFFIDGDTGYIGSNGFILKTTDGGNTWTTFTFGATLGTNILSLFFTDTNTGYAGGSYGKLYKTTDGGQNWNLLPKFPLPVLFTVCHDIYFKDANTGFIAGASDPAEAGKKIILMTTDGGLNWTISYLNNSYVDSFNSMSFPDANTGYAVGRSWGINDINLIKTTDGGVSWFQLPRIPGYLKSIFFTDALNGYAAGSETFGEYDGKIMETTDGGLTWTTTNFSPQLYGLFFTDTHGYAVGDDGTILNTAIDGLAVDTFQNHQISLFPNPAHDYVSLKSENPEQATVRVFDAMGREIPVGKSWSNDTLTLDLQLLNQGFYIVEVINEKRISTAKLIVQ
ncbi:YCF48-related protein [Flavobacterium pallidum]|uniref:Photosynthesis system II assembly factor Ycf48/Hcf136-like domain-containing protein n=1 Tax=Flavobacterium pallidum TaxID=2172098 RepID=A0A2S1SIE9_9FLAO|nr:YCF48-related protein [Flavobacterium pallidum]AWI26170.1 hypothetical protein HYN49_09815 [Flavobacterium pallidum]